MVPVEVLFAQLDLEPGVVVVRHAAVVVVRGHIPWQLELKVALALVVMVWGADPTFVAWSGDGPMNAAILGKGRSWSWSWSWSRAGSRSGSRAGSGSWSRAWSWSRAGSREGSWSL